MKGRLILRQFLTTVVTIFAATSASYACSPAPGEEYDELLADGNFIALAKVTEISVRPNDGSGACLSVSYMSKDVIFGKLPERFAVESCIEETSVSEIRQDEGLVDLGFQVDATVLVGLVPSDETDGALRYMVPSCWGPYHARLDLLSAEDRDLAIDSIRSEIERLSSD